MEYLLSICIPNYNRVDCLERLLQETVKQIRENHLEKTVEICISDDASMQNPDRVIEMIATKNSQVKIVYKKNDINRGMDYNFLQSVLISEGKFCWIIGNDDILEDKAIFNIVCLLEEAIQKNISLIVTPFKVYASCGTYKYTVNPLIGEHQIYNLLDLEQRKNFIDRINHESALFAFLSNSIFRREDWNRHRDMFLDKMNSIFIQMYMNIQSLMEGKNYLYTNIAIIKNYLDESPDGGYKQRMYKISVGLYHVLEYFFEGDERKILQEKLVTPFIIEEFWDDIDEYREILDLKIKRIETYKKYHRNKHDLENRNYKNIIVFGAGKKGRRDAKYLKTIGISVAMFVDNSILLNGQVIDGIVVKNVSEGIAYWISKNRNCKVVISIYNMDALNDMIEQLHELGMGDDDIMII